MVNKKKTENMVVYIPAGKLESTALYTIIFIIDQIKTNVRSFNGFQNVC